MIASILSFFLISAFCSVLITVFCTLIIYVYIVRRGHRARGKQALALKGNEPLKEFVVYMLFGSIAGIALGFLFFTLSFLFGLSAFDQLGGAYSCFFLAIFGAIVYGWSMVTSCIDIVTSVGSNQPDEGQPPRRSRIPVAILNRIIIVLTGIILAITLVFIAFYINEMKLR